MNLGVHWGSWATAAVALILGMFLIVRSRHNKRWNWMAGGGLALVLSALMFINGWRVWPHQTAERFISAVFQGQDADVRAMLSEPRQWTVHADGGISILAEDGTKATLEAAEFPLVAAATDAGGAPVPDRSWSTVIAAKREFQLASSTKRGVTVHCTAERDPAHRIQPPTTHRTAIGASTMNRHILSPTIVCCLLGLATAPPAAGQTEAPELSPEQAILDRRIGTWENVTVIKPGQWVPDGARNESVETIRWILDHAFIEGNAREAGTGLTNTHLISYDPASKSFRFWYFDSHGNCPVAASIGHWDAAAETLRFRSELPDGVSMSSTLRFVDADHAEWGARWTGADGTVLMEIEGRQTRRKGAPGDTKDREIVPAEADALQAGGPPELKRLEPFIGAWTAEVRDNRAAQPVWTAAGGSRKFWTLGGRFLRDEVRNERGQLRLLGFWTFDANAKTHREWYFFPDGNVLEATVAWDEARTTFNLDGKLVRGGTFRGPRQLTGPGSYAWNGVIRNPDGEVVLDMSGRQVREQAQ